MRFCLFASWMQFEVVKLAADCIRGQQPRCPVYLQCCLHCIAIARLLVCVRLSLSPRTHTHAAKSVGFVTPAFLSSDAFFIHRTACGNRFCCCINCKKILDIFSHLARWRAEVRLKSSEIGFWPSERVSKNYNALGRVLMANSGVRSLLLRGNRLAVI